MLPLSEAEDLFGSEDSPDMYCVIGIDPGGTSGWCVAGIHPDAMSGDPDIRIMDNVEFWTAGQVGGDENEQADFLVDLITGWPGARLVIEDFILRKTSMGRELLSPVRITAKLDFAVRPRYFVAQQPALAMSTITDDRQKDLGLWLPGQEHARDAIKHVFTYLRRQRERQIRASAAMRGMK